MCETGDSHVVTRMKGIGNAPRKKVNKNCFEMLCGVHGSGACVHVGSRLRDYETWRRISTLSTIAPPQKVAGEGRRNLHVNWNENSRA